MRFKGHLFSRGSVARGWVGSRQFVTGGQSVGEGLAAKHLLAISQAAGVRY